MPKDPKARSSAGVRNRTRSPKGHKSRGALAEQIIDEEDNRGLRKTPGMKQKKRGGGDDEEEVMDPRSARKVLEVVQAQKAEDDADGGDGDLNDDAVGVNPDDAADVDVSDVEIDAEGFAVVGGASEEDERALAMFLPGAGAKAGGQTLADVILQKIEEAEARKAGGGGPEAAVAEPAGLSPKVVQVYGEIGTWLKTYKSGKLPKAFKVIPNLANWEEVLSLTSPLSWSPAAMYEAVNIFASNLNPKMAQRFYNLVLLPAVRENIAKYGKLNFHYYRALRKSLFKPGAFFKGVMLPLATENCALRESVIMSSALGKASVPPMHAAAVIVRLCTMTPWYGTTSVLLAALINKKYALPLKVIDSLVTHFCAFGSQELLLPVVWHRCLLLLVQRYKFDLNDDQKRRLKELLKVHFHNLIGPEIRRELIALKPGEAPAGMEIG